MVDNHQPQVSEENMFISMSPSWGSWISHKRQTGSNVFPFLDRFPFQFGKPENLFQGRDGLVVCPFTGQESLFDWAWSPSLTLANQVASTGSEHVAYPV